VEKTKVVALATKMLEAWNSQDIDQVLACYTHDLHYRDPNTHEEIIGADSMRRYLARLFGQWTMHWSLREAFAFGAERGAAVLWRATLKRKDGTRTVEALGMDLVLLAGDLIARNDVYFDRTVLAPLAPATGA
jgi:nuclear transport factor 2 (NTF2) superfamily protein